MIVRKQQEVPHMGKQSNSLSLVEQGRMVRIKLTREETDLLQQLELTRNGTNINDFCHVLIRRGLTQLLRDVEGMLARQRQNQNQEEVDSEGETTTQADAESAAAGTTSTGTSGTEGDGATRSDSDGADIPILDTTLAGSLDQGSNADAEGG